MDGEYQNDAPRGCGTPPDCWILLDESTSISRPSSRTSEKELVMGEWAEGFVNDLPIRGTPDGLKAALSMGLEGGAGMDSFVQAERSLSLAVKMDGVDSEFLRRSTETIEALQSRKNAGSPMLLSDDEESEAKPPVLVRQKKYGGRSPPIFASIRTARTGDHQQPEVMEETSSVDDKSSYSDGREGPSLILEDLRAQLFAKSKASRSPCSRCSSSSGSNDNDNDSSTNTTMDSSKSNLIDVTIPVLFRKSERSEKGERRRQRRELKAKRVQRFLMEEEDDGDYLFHLTWASLFNSSFVMPIAISHVCTFLLGLYIGKRLLV